MKISQDGVLNNTDLNIVRPVIDSKGLVTGMLIKQRGQRFYKQVPSHFKRYRRIIKEMIEERKAKGDPRPVELNCSSSNSI